GDELRIDAGDLELPREALARAARCPQVRDVLAGEQNAPVVRAQIASELADEGRLAGAVRPDDRVRLALAHGEVDAVARPQGAEVLRQAAHLKHGPRKC